MSTEFSIGEGEDIVVSGIGNRRVGARVFVSDRTRTYAQMITFRKAVVEAIEHMKQFEPVVGDGGVLSAAAQAVVKAVAEDAAVSFDAVVDRIARLHGTDREIHRVITTLIAAGFLEHTDEGPTILRCTSKVNIRRLGGT